MKAYAQNLLASVAAILFTTASLGALYHNVGGQFAAPATETSTSKIATLATIHVHPSAAERRAAALLPRTSAANVSHDTVTPPLGRIGGGGSASGATPLSLLSAPLAMPYYSFDKKLGSISKE